MKEIDILFPQFCDFSESYVVAPFVNKGEQKVNRNVGLFCCCYKKTAPVKIAPLKFNFISSVLEKLSTFERSESFHFRIAMKF
jgi:hypothetical protein